LFFSKVFCLFCTTYFVYLHRCRTGRLVGLSGFWWPSVNKDLKAFLDKCEVCRRAEDQKAHLRKVREEKKASRVERTSTPSPEPVRPAEEFFRRLSLGYEAGDPMPSPFFQANSR
jgi:hypothetical protein